VLIKLKGIIMKAFFMIFLTIILISCTQKKANKDLLTFELRLADTENKADLKEMVFYNTEQRFFVADSVFLDNSVLVSAEVIDRQSHPKIKVTLNEEGRKKFADFTMNNIGKNAAIIVDGKLVSAPRIMAPITDGILLIVGYFDLKEATNISVGIVP
jgi:preprotein translocase subunit SecD